MNAEPAAKQKSHYNEQYFNWQKNIGAFGGMANLFKFEKYIRPTDCVLDFGSGGGFLLANVKCKEKIGIEINPEARKTATDNGITSLASPDEVADQWADVIISNHALEHVENPLMELKRLHRKLKSGGTIVFVTPYERKEPYVPNDINFHLFTWSEMNLGNLFTLAGFKVQLVEELKHKWPPRFLQLRQVFGESGFHLICKIYGRLKRGKSQVRIVAKK